MTNRELIIYRTMRRQGRAILKSYGWQLFKLSIVDISELQTFRKN